MRLEDRLMKLSSPEEQWGIWADAPFTVDSESRVGRIQLENGGLLDDKAFVGTLGALSHRIETLIDASDGEVDHQREVAVEILLNVVEEERIEMEYLQCRGD